MLCAANAPQDVCGGDSGSPLLELNAPNDHNNATNGHVYAPNSRFFCPLWNINIALLGQILDIPCFAVPAATL